MSRFEATIAALGIGITITLASPAAAENVLRYTSLSGGALTMDPHSSTQNADRAATVQVCEALLDIDSKLAIVPQLALSWKPLDPNTWEFELRPDVRFHDGTPFGAQDVVFSINRARARTSDLAELSGTCRWRRENRRPHHPHHHISARSSPLDAAQFRRHDVESLGGGTRCDDPGRHGQRRDLCLAARQRYRTVYTRGV